MAKRKVTHTLSVSDSPRTKTWHVQCSCDWRSDRRIYSHGEALAVGDLHKRTAEGRPLHNLGHVTTLVSKNGGPSHVRCRCGWSVKDNDLLRALSVGEEHEKAATEPVVPTCDPMGYKAPARPVREEKPVWEPYRRTRSSCTVDIDYGTLGYGEDMTFPTRKAVVDHLREFLPKSSHVRGETVAYGSDSAGEFACVVDFGPKGGVQIRVEQPEACAAA